MIDFDTFADLCDSDGNVDDNDDDDNEEHCVTSVCQMPQTFQFI